jgi:predicted N-acetyltransferase YhbS
MTTPPADRDPLPTLAPEAAGERGQPGAATADGQAVVIRPLADSDVAEVVAVIRAAFEEYRGRLDPPSSAHQKTDAIVRVELADGGGFVACAGSAIVGCVFFHRFATHLYLDRLSVLPAYRGRGAARELIEAVERQACREDVGAVRLTVRLTLEHHRRFYERLGYEMLQYGTHAGYAAPTSVTLQKLLASTSGSG